MAPPGNDERGPSRMGTASSVVQAGEAKISLAYETPAVVDGSPAVVVFDAARSRAENVSRSLMEGSRVEREAYFAGYEDGVARGYELGRKAERDEIDSLHRAAHRVVAAMVRLPERNRRDEEWLSSSSTVEDVHDARGQDIVSRPSSRAELSGEVA